MTREEAIDWLARMKSNTVNHTLDMPLWWNEPLVEAHEMAIKALEQEPTTKNDLGVDCISRADVNQVIEDYMDEQYRVLSDRTRERAFGANAVKARINELQTITLEPKIGHERLTNSEWIDFLSEQFDISRTSAKEMLHTMMSVKKEDNFKKLFSRGKVCLVKAESEDKE